LQAIVELVETPGHIGTLDFGRLMFFDENEGVLLDNEISCGFR